MKLYTDVSSAGEVMYTMFMARTEHALTASDHGSAVESKTYS